jgi:NTE family protein
LRALVFSAGGAFGAYQAGVWQALEEAGVRPRIVAGASVGALNAAAVARGCSASRLQQLWRDPASDVFQWNWPPRGFSLLTTRRLEARLEDLFAELPALSPDVKLLVTLTELATTKTRVVAGAQITPRVLIASCAVPALFPVVRLGGRWYCDGGIFCRAPVEAAVAAGATDIIVVDVLAAPPSRVLRVFLDAAIALRRFLGIEDGLKNPPPDLRLRVIAPPRPLGRLRDIFRWDRTNVDRWIEAGYRAAAAAIASTAAASAPIAESAAPR